MLRTCSKVPKAGDPGFKKEQLPRMWEAKGAHFLATTPRHAGPSLSDSFKLPPEVRSKLLDEFCNVDSNGSGALDPEEMSALFSRLALHVPMRVRTPL